MLNYNRSPIRGALLAALTLIAAYAVAQTEPAPKPEAIGKFSIAPAMVSALNWRSIGPSVMVGRITDIEGLPGDPSTF